jgi:hypothetical protein
MVYALVELAELLQKELNGFGKSGVGAEKEESEDCGHDHDHDRGPDGFLAAGPVDLLDSFDFDLADKFANRNLRHRNASSG